MKFLFIGDAVNKEIEANNPDISVAGNNFQLGFLDALRKQCKVYVVTEMTKAAWPAGRDFFQKKFEGELFDGLKFDAIQFMNVRFFKEVTVMLSVRKAIKKFCKYNADDQCYVISYNGNGPFSVPILSLRKKYHYRYICLVVDPPLYQGTTTRTGGFYKILYKVLADSFTNAAKKCDECVVLNSYYAEKYLNRKDYFVMDCGVVADNCIDNGLISETELLNNDNNRKHIVFTGTLHEHSGIMRFIEMFIKINNRKFDLHIWGKGIYENAIKELTADSDIVFFHGFLPNNKIKKIQMAADFLLCPNTISHPINQVAFPSKIQEYMTSGVPVIATKVNGLGSDYYDYVYIYNDTEDELRNLLNQIVREGEESWKRKGYEAKQFILREKNWDKQVTRLISYLNREKSTKVI